MVKKIHEIRDPIHVFIRLDSDERKVLDSRAFQRLRHIHQLALSYLVYPGATHKRFEHSLGVMELASRVFDVITNPDYVRDPIRDILPQITDNNKKVYWRKVLRIAALCHDLGHLPFSHAAEKELLPEDWGHERITREIIQSGEMEEIWKSMEPPLISEHIVKLALGQEKANDLTFSDWEAILSEIIVNDAFGVDRMDYLLRDSHHAGVLYGEFDHYRLIDTLRILTPPPSPDGTSSKEPTLGVEEGGLHSAEALLLARYFMYSQVYFHPVRRIYDIHLKDFLKEWLPEGNFSTNVNNHLSLTDNEVSSALLRAAYEDELPGHESAKRIICREHFRVLYSRNPDDIHQNPESANLIFESAKKEFGEKNLRIDAFKEKGGALEGFPVLARDERIYSSLSKSEVLKNLPLVATDFVFISPEIRETADSWLKENREKIISLKGESEE